MKNLNSLVALLTVVCLAITPVSVDCAAAPDVLPSAEQALQTAVDRSSIGSYLHVNKNASACEPLLLITNSFCPKDVALKFDGIDFDIEEKLSNECDEQVVVELQRLLMDEDAALVEFKIPNEGVEIIVFLQSREGQLHMVKEFVLEW